MTFCQLAANLSTRRPGGTAAAAHRLGPIHGVYW